MGLVGQEAFLIAVNMLMKKPSNGSILSVGWQCSSDSAYYCSWGSGDGSNSVTLREWRYACRIYGFNSGASSLFKQLDGEGMGSLSLEQAPGTMWGMDGKTWSSGCFSQPRWKMLYMLYRYTCIYIYIRMYFHNGTEKTERNRTYKTMIFTRLLDLQHVICTYNCIYCNYTNWQASFIQNTIGVHIFYFWEYVNIVCINHVKKTMTNLTSPCGDSTKQQPVSGGLLGRLGFSARESWYPTSQKRGNSSAGCAQIYEQQFCIWAAKKVVMLKSWGSGVVRCWNLMVGCEVEVDLYANCLRIGNESMNWTLEEHGRTIIMEGCIFRRQTAPDLGSGDWA